MITATKLSDWRNLIRLSVSAAALMMSGQVLSAPSTYTATEDFSNTLTVGAEDWIAQYSNAGGAYNNGDVGEANYARYNAAVTPPNYTPYFKNGNYLNFYARYDDAGIRTTYLARNFGGWDGAVNAGKDGNYTLTACYFLMPVANGGADFANGVTAGMGIRASGNGYAQWPGDLGFNASTQIPTGAPTGVWTRLSLDIAVTDASRVDAGFWVNNPVLTAPYINTGVLWDDFYFGPAANAPTTACAGGSDLNLGPASNIPTLPWGGLLALIGLMGWLGLRRRA